MTRPPLRPNPPSLITNHTPTRVVTIGDVRRATRELRYAYNTSLVNGYDMISLGKKLSLTILAALVLCMSACSSIPPVQAFMAPCDPTSYSDVVWSPNGEHIAYIEGKAASKSAIFVMTPDGGNVRQLTDLQYSYKSGLEWSPDSTKLLYSEAVVSSSFIVPLDGSPPTRIGADHFIFASWSPDGERVLQLSLDQGTRDLYASRLDGTESTRLTASPDSKFFPDWSPDGQYIAYISENGGSHSLMVMRSDGSGLRRMTDSVELLGWSPDSERLAIIKQGVSSLELHTIRADSSDDQLIVASFALASWLPDSHHLSYVGMGGGPGFTIVDVDNPMTAELLLTHAAYASAGPHSWSPDGSQVVFVAHDYANGNVQEIYIMNRDFSGLTPLTDNPGKQMCFHWPF